MLIGIMSDTHGSVKRTARAIEAMKPFAPARVFHCGDIGSHGVIAELAAGFMEPEVPVSCVLGNVDGWDDDLMSPWPHVRIEGRFFETEVDGKRIAMIHGDDGGRLHRAVKSGAYDYIFTGHTHLRADERIGPTRIINPGALQRAIEPGCAMLDLRSGKLTYLDVA